VLQRRALVSKIRVHVKAQLGGYVKHDMVNTRAGLRELIVSSRRGNDAGVVGALTLAKGAAEKARGRGGGGGGAAATRACGERGEAADTQRARRRRVRQRLIYRRRDGRKRLGSRRGRGR
jgi:hypothetical protein